MFLHNLPFRVVIWNSRGGLRSDEVGSDVLWVSSDPPQSTGLDSRLGEGRAQGSLRYTWKDVMGVIEIPRYARNDINGGLIDIPRRVRNDINRE